MQNGWHYQQWFSFRDESVEMVDETTPGWSSVVSDPYSHQFEDVACSMTFDSANPTTVVHEDIESATMQDYFNLNLTQTCNPNTSAKWFLSSGETYSENAANIFGRMSPENTDDNCPWTLYHGEDSVHVHREVGVKSYFRCGMSRLLGGAGNANYKILQEG